MTDSPAKITVLLVDDHAVVREGYRRLLEKRGNIIVVGEAKDAASAYELSRTLTPQVVVLDISLPGVSGIEATRRILAHSQDTRVLVFSMYEELIYAERALQAGARGYVTKASAPNVLVEAVHAVATGKMYTSADIAHKFAQRQAVTDSTAASGLSTREFEVLRLLVEGRPIRDIAEILGLNPKTVANHQSALKQKLGADTAVQLARIGEALLAAPR